MPKSHERVTILQSSEDRRAGRAERAATRRERMETNRAPDFESAELWDLEFWQRRTPQERLSALVSLHRDLDKIGRRSSED